MTVSNDSIRRGQVWANGDAYEPYVGRWSRLVAYEFLNWLAVPTGSRWIDVGCGTGVLTDTILRHMAPTKVLGIDQSEGFVAYAREKVRDLRASFQMGDAQSLRIVSHVDDATVSGLVLNFVPDKIRMVSEMARVTRQGGMVGLYVWDYSGAMQMMRVFWDAAGALDPAAQEIDEGRRFPICRPEPLRDLFEAARVQSVEVRAIDVPTVFSSFDDYWLPFLGGQGPAPSYVTSLNDEQREALRQAVRERLVVAADGSIALTARAWAVRGMAA